MTNTVQIKVTLTHMQYAVLLEALSGCANTDPGYLGSSAQLALNKITTKAKVVPKKGFK